MPGVKWTVTMSSQIRPKSLYWTAANALDGSEQQNPNKCGSGGCCAGSYVTNAEQWLQVELIEYYLIQHIRILGRTNSKTVNYNNIKSTIAIKETRAGEIK